MPGRGLLSVFLALAARAEVYEVGPGLALGSIGEVPWAALQPGDTVRIHWRAEPYREKWVICRQGTAEQPITVTGVAGPDGQLPLIDGVDAITAPGLNYWSEARGVVKIGGANVPPDTMPRHIIIERLRIRGARSSNRFTDDSGVVTSYLANASAIYLEKCEGCVLRENELFDSGNALFIASSETAPSRDIRVQANYIHSGGNRGSAFEHNVYSAALGIVFEGNRLGRLMEGTVGNNLKDRSAGAIIRYNWIEGGNRQLDLVDAEDSSLIRNAAAYRSTEVYGNVLIEHPGDGNRQLVHYGGDSGAVAAYRKGTLRFHHNTLVSLRTDRTTWFRLSTNDETADVRNNIFYTAAGGNTASWGDASGVYRASANWMKPGWVASFGTFTGQVEGDETAIQGFDPGFADEAGAGFGLRENSEARDRGGEAIVPEAQYVKHQAWEGRATDGAPDLGAFEFVAPPPQ